MHPGHLKLEAETLRNADIERIKTAVGSPLRINYECTHVYPLSAPDFSSEPSSNLDRPDVVADKLYVHVPFCNYGCNFCFYVKEVGARVEEKHRMVQCLVNEIDLIREGTTLSQIYVGGGTPTALPPRMLDDLLYSIRRRAIFSPNLSFTVECSPESLRPEHIQVLQSQGVNRISIGVDTLNPEILQLINRRHNRRQAIQACQTLTGTEAFVNIDLIYGFPGQTEEGFIEDLHDLAAMRPQSFTVYSLRLNEQTPLLRLGGDDFQGDIGRLMRWRSVVMQATRELGYRQTRMHTFVDSSINCDNYKRAPCVDGFSYGRQLGIGPSALSHLGYTLYLNAENTQQYVRRVERGENPVGSSFELLTEDLRTLFVARTLGEGLPLDCAVFEETFGDSIDNYFGPVLSRLQQAGLVERDLSTISLSATGRLVHDLVLRTFYPVKATQWLSLRQQQLF